VECNQLRIQSAMKGHYALRFAKLVPIELTVAKFLGAFALLIPRIPRMIKGLCLCWFCHHVDVRTHAHLSSGDPIFYE